MVGNRNMRIIVRDGMMADGPIGLVLLIGAAGGALLILPARAAWFIGRCVLREITAARFVDPNFLHVECVPVPVMDSLELLGMLGVLGAIGLLYALCLRLSIRYRWERAALGTWYNGADLLIAGVGLLLARQWAQHVPDVCGVTSPWVRLVIPSSPIFCVVWFRLFAELATSALSYYLHPDVRIALMVRVFLSRHFKLQTLHEVSAHCEATNLAVKGPFDAVDARRIEDLIAVYFSQPFVVTVDTTLAPEVYWRPYREDLKPSGYVSSPMRQAQIPNVLIYSVLGVGGMLMIMALMAGPSMGISGQKIGVFVDAMSRRGLATGLC